MRGDRDGEREPRTKFPTASVANRAADRLPDAVSPPASDWITATSDGRRQS